MRASNRHTYLFCNAYTSIGYVVFTGQKNVQQEMLDRIHINEEFVP